MVSIVGSSYIAPALASKCRLIKLKGHTKEALETGWNTTANYSTDDTEIVDHILSGLNYGIMPRDGLIVIDCDTEKLYDNLPSAWKDSLVVITGRNGDTGRHVLLYSPDSPPEKFVIKDPETESPLGDIRGSNSKFYTVGPGSIHPVSGRKYEYENPDAPIIQVPWIDIETHLLKHYPITFHKTIPKTTTSNNGSLASKLGLRIEDFAMPIKPTYRASGDIQGSHPIHGSSTGMNFAINPNKGIWYCYRDNVGGDVISWIAYAHCGVNEECCSTLSQEEFKDVKEWLHNNGYSEQIDALDDEYFSEPNNDVDISNLLKSPDEIELEEEIASARKRATLPEFPDLPDGLFKDYMEFGKRVSYSLPEFHVAASLALISMAVGRKILIQVGMSKIYPNVFAMVIGHTTISGKSVACDMAVDSLSSAVMYEEPLAKFNSTVLMRGTISEAALVQGLNDVYHRLWYYDDCNGFFEDISAWNTHILGTMCTIYDGRPIERTLSRRKNADEHTWFCPEPYMSILFNTTNKDIEEQASSRLFSSGFFPRMMWFIGNGGMPRTNIDVTEDDKAVLADIVKRISYISETLRPLKNNSIVFQVSEEIEKWRLDAVISHMNKEDEAYRTAISRGFIHAYKIAALLAITDPEFQKSIFDGDQSKYPISVKIPHRNAMDAIRIVDTYLVPRTMYVYELCNVCDGKNHQVIVKKTLDHYGGVASRSDLLRKSHLSSRDLTVALKTLVESGEVKICERKRGGSDKPATMVLKL